MSKFTSHCCLAVAFLFFQCPLFGQTDSLLRGYYQFLNLSNQGAKTFQSGRSEAAIAIFESANRLNDSIEPALALLPPDTLKNRKIGTYPNRKFAILMNLMACKAQIGQYEAALEESERLLEIGRKLNSPLLLPLLNNAGGLADDLGQFQKGGDFYREAILIFEKKEKKNATDTTRFISVLNNLGYNYERQDRVTESLPFYRRAVTLRRSIKDPELYYSLLKMGYAQLLFEQLDSSQMLLKEAFLLADSSKTRREHVNFATLQHYLAAYFQRIGQGDSANFYFKKSLERHNQLLGMAHERTLKTLIESGISLAETQQFEQAKVQIDLYNLKRLDNHNRNFSFLTENARAQYVQSVENQYNATQSLQALDAPMLTATLFQNALIYKGILLQQTQNAAQNLNTNRDSSLKRLVKDRQALRRRLDKLAEGPLSIRTFFNADSLEIVAQKLEKQLLKANNSPQMALKNADWRALQSVLKDSEAVVEFVNFKKINNGRHTDSVFYAAYIIRKDAQQPQHVVLFEEKQLHKLLNDSPKTVEKNVAALYRGIVPDDPISQPSADLFKLLWAPLDQFLKDIKTVWYAPTGLLHRVAFDAIPLSINPNLNVDSNKLSDKYILNYVSSARTLLATKTPTTFSDAVVFADINYNASGSKRAFYYNEGLAMRSIAPRSYVRGGNNNDLWQPLTATRFEANSVEKALISRQIAVTMLTDSMASEDYFKSFGESMPSPTILHLATHGFYLPRIATDSNRFLMAENPLLRSGLILAGANPNWQGQAVLEGKEDGILTAYEISLMNLNNTQLAVLSACETGLGDIQSSEGVFGLQRAFKQAGVRYLLASLWKVPDAPTAELMHLFYDNLVVEKDIRRSFQKAQKTMRQRYPNQPLNWAGFVLIE
jgi:CHAT domain-containing protein